MKICPTPLFFMRLLGYNTGEYTEKFPQQQVRISKEAFFMQVTKDMTIGELLMMDRSAGAILMQNGMHCVGCPSAAGETLEEASMVHGMDINKLLDDINAYLASK